MKAYVSCIFLLFITNIIYPQDTIFMKSGARILSEIIETGDIQIKYKKLNSTESAGIYTVFIHDVGSLHYGSGKVINYDWPELYAPGSEKNLSSNTASSDLFMKFGIGLSGNYFNRNASDNLRDFWRYHNQNDKLEVGGNSRYMSVNLSMMAPLGATKRNWLGAQLQLIMSPEDAISAANEYIGLNELKLRTYHYNISMFYGHSINFKKNLIVFFEPSLDIALMTGFIKIPMGDFKVSAGPGVSSHFAVGLDYNISKRFTTNFRIGQRFLKIEERHVNPNNATVYSRFYANPTVNNDLLFVNWGGTYASIGFTYSLYAKIPSGRK